MRRRTKQIPVHLAEAWRAFSEQAERVEAARRALLGCMPVGRTAPVPVSVGLDLLVDELDAVEDQLPAWRVPEVEERWVACRESLDVSRAQVPAARAVADERVDHPRLVITVRNCITPLDVWVDAERHWLGLRVRR